MAKKLWSDKLLEDLQTLLSSQDFNKGNAIFKDLEASLSASSVDVLEAQAASFAPLSLEFLIFFLAKKALYKSLGKKALAKACTSEAWQEAARTLLAARPDAAEKVRQADLPVLDPLVEYLPTADGAPPAAAVEIPAEAQVPAEDGAPPAAAVEIPAEAQGGDSFSAAVPVPLAAGDDSAPPPSSGSPKFGAAIPDIRPSDSDESESGDSFSAPVPLTPRDDFAAPLAPSAQPSLAPSFSQIPMESSIPGMQTAMPATLVPSGPHHTAADSAETLPPAGFTPEPTPQPDAAAGPAKAKRPSAAAVKPASGVEDKERPKKEEKERPKKEEEKERPKKEEKERKEERRVSRKEKTPTKDKEDKKAESSDPSAHAALLPKKEEKGRKEERRVSKKERKEPKDKKDKKAASSGAKPAKEAGTCANCSVM